MRTWTARMSLLARFGVMSLVVIAVLGLVIGGALKRQIESRALDRATQLAESVAELGVQDRLESADLRRPLSPRQLSELDEVLATDAWRRHEISRVKLFNADRKVVYSDDRTLIGDVAPARSGVARALDVVGERWALLVVRELLLGPKRFTDLRAGLPGASPNVLSQRLRELEGAGILRRRKLPPPAASRVYELTGWGKDLEPVIISLGRWGVRSPSKPRDAELSVDSLILSFRTMFDPRQAEGLEASYELRLGEESFRGEVEEGRFEIERGVADRPDAIVETDTGTVVSLVYEGRNLDEALRSGDVRIEGDIRMVERFLSLFPLPEPAAVGA
jgi:DNA-binding HxlR family transcriptional regulator